MKARKVIVTIELETDITIAELKEKGNWGHFKSVSKSIKIEQIHVNVIKKGKK